MKIPFLILVATAGMALADVKCLDNLEIVIDGQNKGRLEDVLKNYSSKADDIKSAVKSQVEAKAKATPINVGADLDRCSKASIIIDKLILDSVVQAKAAQEAKEKEQLEADKAMRDNAKAHMWDQPEIPSTMP